MNIHVSKTLVTQTKPIPDLKLTSITPADVVVRGAVSRRRRTEAISSSVTIITVSIVPTALYNEGKVSCVRR
jgi:hypothetical protein